MRRYKYHYKHKKTNYSSYGDSYSTADEVIKKFGINPLKYLQRLHETRKNVYKTLTSSDRLPIGTVEICLSEKELAFNPPYGWYTLTPTRRRINICYPESG